jgi:Family of unknown function (DUF5677)
MEAAAEGTERVLNAGGSIETAEEAAGDAVHQALKDSTPRVVANLLRLAPKMLRERRRNHRRIRRQVRARWGKALDRFMMLVVAAQEVGREFDKKYRPPDGERFDPVYDALLGLQARACQTALEVYHLLSDGLPKGALARARTLHEIAVTAMVIADYGRRSEHPDLAARFLAHQVVATYKDAVTYQLNCETLGYEPFTDEVMAGMEARRDEAVAKYGPAYKEQYGWAAGLDKATPPTFRDLERLARVSHLRGHYSWASHEVHSDAKGWLLNISRLGETRYRETSYSNDGLADPGHLALISLLQTSISLAFSPNDISPRSIVEEDAMTVLVDKAGDAFLSAHKTRDAQHAKRRRRLIRFRQRRR